MAKAQSPSDPGGGQLKMRGRLFGSILQYGSGLTSVALVLSMALLLWHVMVLWSGTSAPIVVVVSQSMSPNINRGDLLLLSNRFRAPGPGAAQLAQLAPPDVYWQDSPQQLAWNPANPALKRRIIVPGDICVFSVIKSDVPVIHRVIQTHRDPDGRLKVLTKGDANQLDDSWGIFDGDWIYQENIIGCVWAFVPHIGYLSVLLSEWKWIRAVILVGLFGLLLLTDG